MGNYVVLFAVVWLVLGMACGAYVLHRAKKEGLGYYIGFRDVWSRAPFGGPIILLMLVDVRNAKRHMPGRRE